MPDTNLDALNRELYPEATQTVFVDPPPGHAYPWQPFDARLSQYGVMGAHLSEGGILFLQRPQQLTMRERVRIKWLWLRYGLWWKAYKARRDRDRFLKQQGRWR